MLASVLGREFALAAARSRSAMSARTSCSTWLDEAIADRVRHRIVPGGAGRLRFEHVLIRDTLYDGLDERPPRSVAPPGGRGARGALRRATPDLISPSSLTTRWPGSDARQGPCATPDSAGEPCARARSPTRRRRGYTRPALASARPSRAGDERVRCELLLSLGDAESRAGDRHRRRSAAFLDAAACARRLRPAAQQLGARRGYGGRIVWVRAGDDDRLRAAARGSARRRCRRRRHRAPGQAAGPARGRASATSAARDRRDALSREAVELARRTGSPDVLAPTRSTARGRAVIAPDTDPRSALPSAASCVRRREQTVTRSASITGVCSRIVAQLLSRRGRRRRRSSSRRGAAWPTSSGSRSSLWDVRGAQAMLALATGRLDEAEELVGQTHWSSGERAAAGDGDPDLPSSSATRSATSAEASRRSSRRSATLVDRHPARPVLPLCARSRPCPDSGGRRRRKRCARRTSSRDDCSRFRSIRSGSTA